MRWLLWLYPRAWRERYGAELAALVEDSGAGWQILVNVAGTGLGMRVVSWWPMLAGGLVGAGLGVGGTFWMTPFRVSSFALRAVGYEFTQQKLDRVSVTDAALANVIKDQNLLERERLWLPSWAVTFLFRQAIVVRARDGWIEASYIGRERNFMVTSRLMRLFDDEWLPKNRAGMHFQMKDGEGNGEPRRPYPVALPVFGALLGIGVGGLGRRLSKGVARDRGRP